MTGSSTSHPGERRPAPIPISLMSVAGSVSAGQVGLDPVGEVMGCCVKQSSWTNWTGCGYFSSTGAGRALYQIDAPVVSYRPYTDGVRSGYQLALDRLRQEATVLGADGVIDIRLAVTQLGDDQREYLALGTAVRARSPLRTPRPFLADLTGTAVATLMTAGWMPAGLCVGFSVAIRHDDLYTANQLGWTAGNTEVESVSELIMHTRSAALRDVERSAAAIGVEGVLVNRVEQKILSRECTQLHDRIVEVVTIGTGIVQFGQIPSAALDRKPLLTMPLTHRG